MKGKLLFDPSPNQVFQEGELSESLNLTEAIATNDSSKNIPPPVTARTNVSIGTRGRAKTSAPESNPVLRRRRASFIQITSKIRCARQSAHPKDDNAVRCGAFVLCQGYPPAESARWLRYSAKRSILLKKAARARKTVLDLRKCTSWWRHQAKWIGIDLK